MEKVSFRWRLEHMVLWTFYMDDIKPGPGPGPGKGHGDPCHLYMSFPLSSPCFLFNKQICVMCLLYAYPRNQLFKKMSKYFQGKIRMHSTHGMGRKFSRLLSDADLRVRKRSEHTIAA